MTDSPPAPASSAGKMCVAQWQCLALRHAARVRPHAEAFVARRAAGAKHPVWDFLFTYYSFSPRKLMTWVPAMGQILDVPDGWNAAAFGCEVLLEHPPMQKRDLAQARWIADLFQRIQGRPARFGCHGLHESAMVYRQSAEEVRHNLHPLRLSPGELADFVESQPLTCTHYDAFRFFTPEARPRNASQLTLDSRLEMEQGGCLHVNMDLYKWAYKLWPWIGSDLVADTFELALEGRALDMRASPYDLAALGFPPICIETEQGREEYRREQQILATKAQAVRQSLLEGCQALVRLAD